MVKDERVEEGEWSPVQCGKPSRLTRGIVNRGLESR